MGGDKRRASKFWEKLTFQFAGIFVVFAACVIIVSSYIVHTRLQDLVRRHSKETVCGVARNLASAIGHDGRLFRDWQRYIFDHKDVLDIDLYGTSHQELYERFQRSFQEVYPGKVFGADITFNQLPEGLKREFAAYYLLYWTVVFDEVRDAFDLPYAYYITVDEPTITYVIDADRFQDEDDPGRLLILDTDEQSREQAPVMYKVWERKTELDELDILEDEYGYTCTYYVPIVVDDELIGLVAADGDVTVVDREIKQNTLILAALFALAVTVGVIILSRVVYREYVSRLAQLNEQVERYGREKDAGIADEIRGRITRNDEITTLALNFASMVKEIESHIKNVVSISGELLSARERAAKLDDLARTDAMTGLMNKLSYTECMDRLDRQIKGGCARFSVTMIDLNFLKRMNDTLGHDAGDAAISRLATYITEVYPKRTSFRIGGDEFVAVLEGDLVNETESRKQQLLALIKGGWTDDPVTQLSAAIGSATYTDEDCSRAVFDKADADMYESKKAMKAVRKS